MSHLSLTGRRWMLREPGSVTGSIAERLLELRKIEALGEGEILEDFGHDARQFRDFTKASQRTLKAIDGKEKIGVFGDYDCDGITGAALLVRFLRRRGVDPATRLPHRLKEGYGLRTNIVEEFAALGVTLLLTVDTGVTAVDPIACAKELGIDVIVLDHHTLPPVLPVAHAILHPTLAKDMTEGAPCGAGVAWSFVRALEENDGHEDWDEKDTDTGLAAIGTVADIVELRGGNRTLTHAGLLALSRLKEGPLALLCMHAGLTSPYTSRDIGFRIAPRLNAAGRMADPHIALHALLGDTNALLQLDGLNRQRQDVVSMHLEELLPIAERERGPMLCFVHEDYSPGICGLLAGRLCEIFGKPSLVAGSVGGQCVASLRSIPGYDVTASLARMGDLLLNFGGHAMAAGCAFRLDDFSELRDRLHADAALHINQEQQHPTLSAECVIDVTDVTVKLCDELRALEPFGQGNPEPRFLIEGVMLENVRCVGKGAKHLQATVRGRKVIGFGLGHLSEHAGEPLDLLCRVGIDTWQGRRNPQLFLDDLRLVQNTTSKILHPKQILKIKS